MAFLGHKLNFPFYLYKNLTKMFRMLAPAAAGIHFS